MPFDLTNAPSTFQALMNSILRPFLRRCVLVFFDDILIYSSSWTEHLQHVRAVLSVLRAHSLVLKHSKCLFRAQRMHYLGHIISKDGVAMDSDKVDAVRSWPLPRSVRALRGFLGLTGYYRRFIHNYGLIVGPLTALMKKEAFHWTSTATTAFDDLKQALTTGPVLQLPDFDKSFVVDCNASGTGYDAVLHQGAGPIAFFSRVVAPQHAKLAAYKRELIGLVQAVRHWRPYLWPHEFVIRTDHCSLKHLLDQRLSTIPQHTWVSKLLGYSFQVEYKPGKQNAAANALSRRHEDSMGSIHALSRPSFGLFAALQKEVTSLPELQAKKQEKFAVCQRNKTEHLHPAGLLQPLDVPHAVWSDIAMDFVKGFPKVGGKSVVLTVVDRFSKMAHFIPLGHPYTALTVAQAFFEGIVRLHGFPCSIVSDRDPVFTSTLKELFSLAGIKLRLSSAFRPQTDGQSESSLQSTPFKVVFGRDPPSLLSYQPGLARVQAVDIQMQQRDEFLLEIREHLLRAQEIMWSHHDQGHRDVSFAVGDWAWLRLHQRSASGITARSNAKLAPRFYGPFQVVERVGLVAYCLCLPPKARIHDVFHVVFLKKHHGDPPASPRTLPAITHGRVIPTPFAVVRARPSRGSWELLVRWDGHGSAMLRGSRWTVSRKSIPISSSRTSCFPRGGSAVDSFFGKKYQRRPKKNAGIVR
ncbi:hypothetical protein U9M48_013924 [Paspalum notatum var. saurae]|uniref:Uncharacterized protein n=1 Tax=Paspalum notatum var. saurae TaxID=547442 RepID=A0AAQ3T0Y1_PASNO